MRFSCIRARGVVAVSAAIMALQGVTGLAQFVPYSGNANQGYNTNQGYRANQGYNANQGNNANQGYNQYQAHTPWQGQPAQQVQPQYTAMAFQGALQGSGSRGLNQPVESVDPGPVMQSAPNQNYTNAPAVNSAQSTPAPMGYESYSSGGSATGSCGSYNTFDGGCGIGSSCGGTGCGVDGGCFGSGRRCGGRRWFGGVYSLYMQRSGNAWIPLGYATTTPAWGNYPTDMEIGLTTQDVDPGYQAGAEIRFGSTFGNAVGCGPVWGWEVAYWGLAEDTATARLDDMSTFATDGNRTYSMIDFRGLEVDMGSGYRPVNSYFDYGMPQADHTNDPGFVGTDLEIRSLVVRNTFSAQSMEFNLLRLPMFGGGATCGGSCGGGGCDTGGCASGGNGYGVGRGLGGRGGIAPFYGPRHSLTTLMGVRFVRFDEDFSLDSDVDLVTGGTTVGSAFMDYDVETDNQLVGFQLGCNGIYRLGCQGRWALRYGSSFGVYGNRMEMSQRFDLPTGGVATRFVDGTQNFDVNSTKNDVAFLGELRAGGSYQYSQNWRLYGGWRALAASGVALTTDQISTGNFITPAQAGYINSSGSIFLHGVQAGIECTY